MPIGLCPTPYRNRGIARGACRACVGVCLTSKSRAPQRLRAQNKRHMAFDATARNRPARRNFGRLTKVLRDAPMMVWLADAEGAVTFVNRKWLTFTGRRLRDELRDGWIQSV